MLSHQSNQPGAKAACKAEDESEYAAGAAYAAGVGAAAAGLGAPASPRLS